jgi:hypothetical protein
VQQHNVVAVGDLGTAEPYPHPPAQRLGVQQALGERIRDKEPADRTSGERSLLPG